MPIDPNEPLWREDIEAQRSTTEALWKTQYGFVTRLEGQDAPEALVDRMVAINNLFHQAHEILQELLPYFPEEPQYPR